MAALAPLSLAAATHQHLRHAELDAAVLRALAAAAARRAAGRSCIPALELLVHGGVGFAPYRARFAAMAGRQRDVGCARSMPPAKGFFAIADRGDGRGAAPADLDNGLFFEFVRPADLGERQSRPALDRRRRAGRGIRAGRLQQCRAVVLRARRHGDAGRTPPAARAGHRTHLLVAVGGRRASDRARNWTRASPRRRASVGRSLVEYAAAALSAGRGGRPGGASVRGRAGRAGGPGRVRRALDASLQRLNEDYAAHRGGGFGLREPRIRLVGPGAFARWMQARGKLGGQNKVPRVSASAEALADIG